MEVLECRFEDEEFVCGDFDLDVVVLWEILDFFFWRMFFGGLRLFLFEWLEDDDIEFWGICVCWWFVGILFVGFYDFDWCFSDGCWFVVYFGICCGVGLGCLWEIVDGWGILEEGVVIWDIFGLFLNDLFVGLVIWVGVVVGFFFFLGRGLLFGWVGSLDCIFGGFMMIWG